MNCLFCQHECQLVFDKDWAKEWTCPNHKDEGVTEVMFWTWDSTPIGEINYHIMGKYKEKLYRAFFTTEKTRQPPFSLQYYSSGALVAEGIVDLNFLPNITPRNFLKKLATMLVFS